jgi:hypothetical protein
MKRPSFATSYPVWRLPFVGNHDDEELAVVFTQIMYNANVRMIQSGRRPGFTPEAGQMIGVCCELRRQRFDGDVASEVSIVGFPHFAHPALSDGGQNFVVADACVGFHCVNRL